MCLVRIGQIRRLGLHLASVVVSGVQGGIVVVDGAQIDDSCYAPWWRIKHLSSFTCFGYDREGDLLAFFHLKKMYLRKCMFVSTA